MNSVILVGRLVSDLDVKTLESGKEVTKVSLAVNRGFKNINGVYEVDFFDCILWEGLAVNTSLYCKKGDTVGVHGRLQTSFYEKDGIKRKVVEVVVEKITFFSSKKDDTKEIED